MPRAVPEVDHMQRVESPASSAGSVATERAALAPEAAARRATLAGSERAPSDERPAVQEQQSDAPQRSQQGTEAAAEEPMSWAALSGSTVNNNANGDSFFSPDGEDEMEAAADARLRAYSARYDDLRLQKQVTQLEAVAKQLREREAQLERFYRDTTLPVTDDVGIALGQLREAAADVGAPQIDAALDRLETAIENQMLAIMSHTRGGVAGLVEDTEFKRKADRAEARRIRRRQQIEQAAMDGEPVTLERAQQVNKAAGASVDLVAGPNGRLRTDGHATGVVSTTAPRVPPLSTSALAQSAAPAAPGSPGRRTPPKARSSTAGFGAQSSMNFGHSAGGVAGSLTALARSDAGMSVRASHGPSTGASNSGAGGGEPVEAPAPILTPADVIGGQLYLSAEALAKTLRCERVRMYMATEDGLTVKHVTSFPAEPPAALPPQLPRSLLTTVFMRGVAVAGFQQSRDALGDLAPRKEMGLASARVLSSIQQKQKAAAAAASDGLPRCTLVFPITVWAGGQRRIAGIIECLDKEPVEDEVSLPGESGGSAASATGTGSNNGRRFTARDEALTFTTAQLLGGLMERYPLEHFYADLGSTVKPLTNRSAATSHLPAVIEGEIAAAAQTANRSLRAPPTISIFRGPMTTVHRFAARKEDAKKDALGGVAAGPGVPPSAGGGGGGGGNELRNVEESLDSLNAMWRRAYEDNVRMHRHCRSLTERSFELRRLIERFEEALGTARELTTIEDVHDYLRTVELSLKTGKAADVERAVDAGVATAKRARELAEREAAQQQQNQQSADDDGADDNNEAEPEPSAPATNDPAASSSVLGAHLVPERRGSSGQLATAGPTPKPPTPQQQQQPPQRVRTAPRRGIPVSELHVDGPQDVRVYTVDPASKAQQLQAIEELINAEKERRLEAERRRLARIPGFARSTASASRRRDRGPFELPPDAVEIERAKEQALAKKKQRNARAEQQQQQHAHTARGASVSLEKVSSGSVLSSKGASTLTGTTPFRLAAPPLPSPRR